jgi:tRNA(Ile)-lysidine synthase
MGIARPKVVGHQSGATVRAIVRAWRELTGGTVRDRDRQRRTLIACSGGGDSSGLVLALVEGVTRATEVFVVAHVVHDLRPASEALADRDSARELAARLGLPFVEAKVQARGSGENLEAAARRLRYAELKRMAQEAGCGYVATAHHAEDQLETMLMAILRGAGPRGLSGIAPSRELGGVKVIRPALEVGRVELRRLCRGAGWEWREDATNLDESRLRAAVRARIVPELEQMRPGAAGRAVRAAALVRGAAKVVSNQARRLVDAAERSEGLSWRRGELRAVPEVVLGELVRVAHREVAGGTSADRLGSRGLRPIARAIRDRGTEPREFAMGGVIVEVTARSVRIRKALGIRHEA